MTQETRIQSVGMAEGTDSKIDAVLNNMNHWIQTGVGGYSSAMCDTIMAYEHAIHDERMAAIETGDVSALMALDRVSRKMDALLEGAMTRG